MWGPGQAVHVLLSAEEGTGKPPLLMSLQVFFKLFFHTLPWLTFTSHMEFLLEVRNAVFVPCFNRLLFLFKLYKNLLFDQAFSAV